MPYWYTIFYSSLFILFYSYIGYGALLYLLLRVKRLVRRPASPADAAFEPEVTFMVTAYNESDCIRAKIENTLQLDYPASRLHIVFVTDGSTDATNEIIREYPRLQLLYQPERRGKTAAMNRAMAQVRTPVTVFSDANTMLNAGALRYIVQHFAKPDTGAVAGEKRTLTDGYAGAESAGEGMYWKYESLLKKWDAELYSAMGAAGELFAVRTRLYEAPPPGTVLDDFIISFGINKKGYKVVYEPGAYALEAPSASLADEYRRKVRISAGGFQSIVMLRDLFNIFRYPRITWQYVSHRVLRWTLAPLGLPLLLLSNTALVATGAGAFYTGVLVIQALFYSFALAGYITARKGLKYRYLYIPFYFVFMNIAVYHGFIRFMKGKQPAAWERSQRSAVVS